MSNQGRSARGRLRAPLRRRVARPGLRTQASPPAQPDEPERRETEQTRAVSNRTNPGAAGSERARARRAPNEPRFSKLHELTQVLRRSEHLSRGVQTNPNAAASEQTAACGGIPRTNPGLVESKRTRASRTSAGEGIGAEVIDRASRSTSPPIVVSVRRINRLVVVREAWKFGGSRCVGDLG